MIRKTLSIILSTIIAAMPMLAINPDWHKYPVFSDRIDQVVETTSKVYYLSGGNLYSYSPTDNEAYTYNHINYLNGGKIDALYYNPDKRYMLVVYDDSNIDVLTDDGNVISLPDVMSSTVSGSKKINDVSFGSEGFVLATDFGIVIFNDSKFEVVESGIYNQPINTAALINDHLLIAYNKAIWCAPIDIRHNNLEKFKKIYDFTTDKIAVLGDDIIAVRGASSGKIFARKIDFKNYVTSRVYDSDYAVDNLYMYYDGWYGISGDKLLKLKGAELSVTQLPAPLAGQIISILKDDGKLWCGDADGLAQYDINGSSLTVLHDKMLYPGYITDQRVGYMRWSRDNQRLYISNLTNSAFRPYCIEEGSNEYQTTNVLTDGVVRDVSLKNASATHAYSTKYQKLNSNTRMYGDPTWIVEDPDDTDKYYCGNMFEGVYVIKRNPETDEYEEIGKFNSDNSTFTENWGPRVMFVDIDKEGNLWVGYRYGEIVSILPVAKRRQDPNTITKADWLTYSCLSGLNYGGQDLMMLICKKSNTLLYCANMYEQGFVAVDTKGTLDPSDDTPMVWSKMIDQDGNTISYNYITFFLEDNRGCVWVGTSNGIFEITDPSKATDHNMRVRRIKVPRNDGTNYADYLLESEFINWMCNDPSGRKWIATQASGLYLVSETGDKILEHYDTENSPLRTNSVTAIECDRKDNTVYVGTEDGLYTFKSDSSPGHEDYSEIYAYPNPVRPEYSGVVTITGLMENSVVKITDSVGNVVAQMRSEGGMATWDVCNGSGQKVRSGVYYVYASNNNDGTSTGAVTKILVIN